MIFLYCLPFSNSLPFPWIFDHLPFLQWIFFLDYKRRGKRAKGRCSEGKAFIFPILNIGMKISLSLSYTLPSFHFPFFLLFPFLTIQRECRWKEGLPFAVSLLLQSLLISLPLPSAFFSYLFFPSSSLVFSFRGTLYTPDSFWDAASKNW